MKTRLMRNLMAAVLCGAAGLASAGVPNDTAFTYQGELKDNGGIANGVYDFEFRLADAASMGLQLGSTLSANDVQVVDGKFTVVLDFGNQWNGEARWLDIRVRPGDSVGSYTTLNPRQPMKATPYAHGVVLPLVETGAAAAGLITLTNTNTPAGSVMKATSGAASGAFPGGFFQPVISADTNIGNGIFALTSANGAYALYAVKTGTGGRGIAARHDGTSGNVATFDLSTTTNSSAAVDINNAGTGIALDISSTNSQTSSSALRILQSGEGPAAFFDNTNNASIRPTLDVECSAPGNSLLSGTQDNGIAIKGESTGSFGVGVMGRGLTAGVFGFTATSSGSGIWGISGASGNGGSGVPAGVRGEASAAGVAGGAFFNNVGTALYAQSTSGTAGFFSGNVTITGSISKGSGSFKIDHPLDPENKFLYHSFVESPDMMNIYNGVVTLDDNGNAAVTLPDYFAALNVEYRYQLTCVGGFAPVFISKEIENNRFEIAGGKPGLKVSWQVTGIRNDAFAASNRIQVEVEKAPGEKGKFLYPAGFGAGPDRQIGGGKVDMNASH